MKSLDQLYLEEREGLARLIMDKENLICFIEPDTLGLIQKFWSAGLNLIDHFKAKAMDKVFINLMDGPWDNRDLDLLYTELMEYEKLMAGA